MVRFQLLSVIFSETVARRSAQRKIDLTTTVYYFSGTGNSLKIARMLSSELEECELIPMVRLWKLERILAPEGSIGFVFPMYSYGLPDLVERFVKKIEFERSDYIFTVVTRGGAQGCALQKIEDLLLEKSRYLNSGYYVDMPSNYIPFNDVVPKEKQKKIFATAEKKMKKIVMTIKAKRTKGEKDKMLLRKFAQGNNRTFIEHVNLTDENFLVDRNCGSCGFCARICPVDNIIMVNGFPSWQHHCQSCLACLHFCFKGAIQYKKKTIGKKRYHHPDVTFKDIESQKQKITAKKIVAKKKVSKIPIKQKPPTGKSSVKKLPTGEMRKEEWGESGQQTEEETAIT